MTDRPPPRLRGRAIPCPGLTTASYRGRPVSTPVPCTGTGPYYPGMSDRPVRTIVIAALLGGIVGSALTMGAALLLMPSQGPRGPEGPSGAVGPAGPPGAAAPPAQSLTEADVRRIAPDLTGSYVVKGGASCPDGSQTSRVVTIPSGEATIGETLTLCYFGLGMR